MNQLQIERIFGPDVEDPIDKDTSREDVNCVGAHNILDTARVICESGSGGGQRVATSYQDRMLVTLCFSDPEISTSHLHSLQPKRIESAPLLRAVGDHNPVIENKIKVCLSTSKSDPSVYRIEDPHTKKLNSSKNFSISDRPSTLQIDNFSDDFSDFTSVFTNETEPDVRTVLPGQIQVEERERGQNVLIKEKNVHENQRDKKTRKNSWWRQICLLCMSRQY